MKDYSGGEMVWFTPVLIPCFFILSSGWGKLWGWEGEEDSGEGRWRGKNKKGEKGKDKNMKFYCNRDKKSAYYEMQAIKK